MATLIEQLRQAKATYTAAVQQALGAADPDTLVAALLNGQDKKPHWTQTPAGRRKMAQLAKGNTNRKRMPFRKGAGQITGFVVGTLRAAEGGKPVPRVDLMAALKANGYRQTAVGALVRHRYLKLTRDGYVLGPAAKRVQV